jgi:hypothetical protein
MVEHICDRRAKCTEEAKTEVGCGPEYEDPPSLANMCEFIPPLFASPLPPLSENDNVNLNVDFSI